MPDPIRVTLQQPIIPAYRIPVFRELADRPGIQLTVAYGDADSPGLSSVAPDGFESTFAHISHIGVARRELLWHPPQIQCARRATTDVLILSWNLHYALLIPALIRARLNGVRTILWGHGYSKQDGPLRAGLRHRVGRMADATLFYNHTAARSHILCGLDPSRAFVALNSLDQSPIQAARDYWLARPDELAAFQAQKGLTGSRVILFVSRLDPANRLDLLLRALPQLPSDTKVVIVGKGQHESALRALADSLHLADRVHFAGAIYNEMQLAPYFLSSHIFCYPANIGLSILHAFGYGLPVITSDHLTAQNPEIEALVPHHNGLLYADGKVDTLAATLRSLLNDEALRSRLATQAHLTATHHFSLANMVDGLVAAINFAYRRSSNTPPLDNRPTPLYAAPPKGNHTSMPPEEPDIPSSTIPAAGHAGGSKPFPRPLRLAIIANANAPYRQHLHLRIAREMPEVELYSVFTHDTSNAPWTLNAPAEIRPVLFGAGEKADDQAKVSKVLHEWRKGGKVIDWLRDHAIDVVMLLGYNDPGRMRILHWCNKTRIPVLIWGDSNIKGDRVTGWKRAVKNLVLRRILARCSAVLPCGRLGMEFFARYGVPREKMHLFTLEPDYSLIEQLPQSVVDEVAAKYDVDRARHRLIYSGRLVQEKRVDLLIQAFAQIAEKRPDWDLIIVGNGPLRNKLGTMVPEHLKQRVIWPGFLGDQRYVTAFYKLSDVLVLPSDSEPWALVINEAAAAGLAIIASDVVGAAAELIQDGVNGHLFPAGDPDSLTHALADATDSANTGRMKQASIDILATWRREADPVTGLKHILKWGRYSQ